MSDFKAMKFKVNSPEHSKAIQEKLFEMGYKWGNKIGQTVSFVDQGCLYVNSDGQVLYSADDAGTYSWFYRSTGYGEEHFLVNDEFVDKNYWTQPATAPKAVSTPLQSRKEHRIARMFALLQAMQEALADGKKVPQEWAEEFVQLNEENNNA